MYVNQKMCSHLYVPKSSQHLFYPFKVVFHKLDLIQFLQLKVLKSSFFPKVVAWNRVTLNVKQKRRWIHIYQSMTVQYFTGDDSSTQASIDVFSLLTSILLRISHGLRD